MGFWCGSTAVAFRRCRVRPSAQRKVAVTRHRGARRLRKAVQLSVWPFSHRRPTPWNCCTRGRRVASHARSRRRGGHTTVSEHMPEGHRAPAEWTPQRLVRWAGKAGPSTAALVKHILAARVHPEQGFRSCLGLMRLGKRFGEKRLEAACRRALALGAHAYKNVEAILKNGLGSQTPATAHPGTARDRSRQPARTGLLPITQEDLHHVVSPHR